MSEKNNFIIALENCLGAEQVLSRAEECWAYGADNSRIQAMPDAVAFATNHEQVVVVVQICHQFNVPLVVRGRGTATTGAAVPLQAGLVLSLERMNQVISFEPGNRLMIVEPGIINTEVQRLAASKSLFWAPDPSSANYCTVGGNLAVNAAGPRAVKYGSSRDNILGLKAVTGTGETIQVGSHTTKHAVGYDLTRLLIGSEGTLAIITQATLKLLPLAETKCTLRALFTNIESATVAIAAIMTQPFIPCALEFMDSQAVNLIRHHDELDLPENVGAMLIIEVDGAENSMEAAKNSIARAVANEGLINLKIATNVNEAELLWKARKALSPALRHIAIKKINEDVVVPVSQLPALIAGLQQLSERYQITIVNFGHAGNGNIHVNLLFDPNDRAQAQHAEACLDEVFSLVLRLEGSLSGEHGIGISKRDFLARELDAASLKLMWGIKKLFDPNNILNPGKVLPELD